MSRFLLERLTERGDATGGMLSEPGGGDICATLEDAYHDPKIHGKTRIWAGLYRLGFHTPSHFDAVYRARLAAHGIRYRGMIQIRDVEAFEWVLVHCGNVVADTDGCVLVGERVAAAGTGLVIPAGETWPAFFRAYAQMADAIEIGGAQIEIRDPAG
jgi:hypothetical protein